MQADGRRDLTRRLKGWWNHNNVYHTAFGSHNCELQKQDIPVYIISVRDILCIQHHFPSTPNAITLYQLPFFLRPLESIFPLRLCHSTPSSTLPHCLSSLSCLKLFRSLCGQPAFDHLLPLFLFKISFSISSPRTLFHLDSIEWERTLEEVAAFASPRYQIPRRSCVVSRV